MSKINGAGTNAIQNTTDKKSVVTKENQQEVIVPKEVSLTKDGAQIAKQTNGTVPKQNVSLAEEPKTWQDAKTGKMMSESEMMKIINDETAASSHKKVVNAVGGIGVVTGLISGAGIMLTAKSMPMTLVGAGILGGSMLLPNIIKGDGKGTASGAVAFGGAMASMATGVGAGVAVSKMTGNPTAGAIASAVVIGVGILATIAASDAIKK